jgi:hypothetical protein
MGCWGCVVRGTELCAGVSGVVAAAALLGAAGVSTERGVGAVVFTALGVCGVLQQYHTNAMQTAAKRIAKRLCSASIDGGLYSDGGGLSGFSRR